MKLPLHFAKPACLALALIAPLALAAQSALQKQHEDELARAEQKLKAAESGAKTPGDGKAGAMKEKAMALVSLGRASEALMLLREAAALAPGDYDIQLRTGIALDAAGDHAAAADAYETLSKKLRAWQSEKISARKAGKKNPPDQNDARALAVTFALSEHIAFNQIFRGEYDKALATFTRLYETRIGIAAASEDTDNYALWRIWLTAKIRDGDGLRTSTAIEVLAGTLKVSSPWSQAMLKYCLGKAAWADVPAAIDAMNVSDAEKENARTRAHFFAAGHLRYVKHDGKAALELLQAEDARPFNGCVERILIRNEIAAMSGPAGSI